MIQVQILYVPGCPHHTPARELVLRASRMLGIEVALEEIAVTESSAIVPGFAGSPTILVENQDVEDPQTAVAAPSCRVYENQESRGLPAIESLLSALTKSGEAQAKK